MKYVKLGHTGLDISSICLGCMTFGEPEHGYPSWSMPDEESRSILKQAIDAGINFFDTANVYSAGSSEEILGRAIRDFASRDEVVIATKVRGSMRPGPNGGGLSRKAIFTEIDASLNRLGTDYIDLYQIHRLDPAVPMEETLEALHDVVKSGKVRYIGASSMYAWQFSKALHLQKANGWVSFVSMQDHYNLLNREEEREMLPLCADQGIGVIPWSPLARGRLTRDWDTVTDRSSADPIGNSLYDATEAADKAVVEKVASIAAARGIARAQVALAWLLRNPVISAPIVGAGKPGHLEDALAALDVSLTDEEVAELEAPYVPHPAMGIS
ncbi:aldo/keto reductase [Streptomyces cocklensis]|uniref:1-deoxyxylulose-5-phosphate synthase YajO n=1 Tax=Actinacidiphila cocklensis TaxID=887465 RepID=A0A9W4DX90_9ACTN|nr:aldo/keto reductase [Actinacidiphila cocklensis]MDD1059826.1 aldo/keto reductase [Actinacidiphila cocklensis]WSX72695.1 aldo/keto reductase [Streptomyces sp. NBC_00899]WSX81237.1 aldo/keto reductase [Streptomyces sp. NBC_00899]CAG6397109.1 1-deoxyxylulose-5-phosphate synthase YajO [Actinacidiphila cocklensis]